MLKMTTMNINRVGLVLAMLVSLACAYNVSYDHRAFIIDGQRTLIQSGSIHYPRATPDMWDSIMKYAKQGGLNTIETYVFWNLHELAPGVFDFSTAEVNLREFLRLAQQNQLYVILRIGPYICAEWTYGGLPVWLRDIPGIEFRTYNMQWLQAVLRFVTRVVEEVDPYLAKNGGPIIMMQIENEYGTWESYYGDAGKQYVKWSAQTALSFNAQVPWIMCVQEDAPPTVVNTCNGFYCDNWLDQHFKSYTDQPGCWTENWAGWFQDWGQAVPHRPVEDIAFAVARFIARGGSFHNYYMYFGGTNFARTSGGPFIITSYDYDVALNEYGFPHEPKYTHSKNLHVALSTVASAVLAVNQVPTAQSLGFFVEAHVYGTAGCSSSSSSAVPCCAAFLSNINADRSVNVSIFSHSFELPAWSVSIVDCSSSSNLIVLHNTATIVNVPQPVQTSNKVIPASTVAYLAENMVPRAHAVHNQYPLEQVAVTLDNTDYLLYTTSITWTAADIQAGAWNLSLLCGDYYHVFVNGQHVLSAQGTNAKQNYTLPFTASFNEPHVAYNLTIVSQTNGLINFASFMEQYARGLGLGLAHNTSEIISINGVDLTNAVWSHTSALLGEEDKFYNPKVASTLPWTNLPASATPPSTPFMWYKVTFPAFDVSDNTAWALDLSTMHKGQVWMNGHSLGRFWDILATQSVCTPCDYRGSYQPLKCMTGCQDYSQRYYHVPRAWLSNIENEVILIDEIADGKPFQIQLLQMH